MNGSIVTGLPESPYPMWVLGISGVKDRMESLIWPFPWHSNQTSSASATGVET
jgi:hypothetical protein